MAGYSAVKLNSFSEERVEDNFSIDSILDGLVACDEPVSQNSDRKSVV